MISILHRRRRRVCSSRCLATPLAVRAFRAWGWGQRIREDGPHTHLEKMGTPTMGGIVILAGLVLAYLVIARDDAAGHRDGRSRSSSPPSGSAWSGSSTTTRRCAGGGRSG